MRASLTSVADARIDKGERDIGSDHTDENEERNKHTVRKHEIDIFLQNRFIHETPDARIREDDFKHERTGKKTRKQIRASRDIRVERIAERVIEVHPFFARTAGSQSGNIGHSHLIEHRRAYHAERGDGAAQKRSEERKKCVMHIRKRKSSGRKRKRKIGISGHRKKTGSRCEELQQNQKQYARKCVKKKRDESYSRIEFRTRFA